MYRVTKYRGGHANQFDYTAMYVIVQILDCSLEKRSRYLQALLFLRGAFCSDDVI
jgi:hypothetical protein